jgi:hypothetical protein
MSLLVLQEELRSWLHDGLSELPRGFHSSAAPGLRVYRNNYRSQLINCLEMSFPLTRAWIGDEALRAACETHVDTVPPSSWTIDAYAQGFPDTLAKAHASDPEVYELAWLEWALGEAFVAADELALSAADLAGVDWDSAHIRLIDPIWTIEAKTNAGAILPALTADEMPPAAERIADGCRYLVWHYGLGSRFRTIVGEEYEALLKLGAGSSFAALCNWLVDDKGEDEGIATAGQMLGQWIGEGLIADVSGRGQ